MTIRVVVGQDDFLVREGVARVLEQMEGVQFVAAGEDLDSLRASVETVEPDVVLTDIRLAPTRTDEGVRLAAELRHSHPGVGVVILSRHVDPGYVRQLFADGSDGRAYLLEDRLRDEVDIRQALEAVTEGRSLVDSRIVERLLASNHYTDPLLDRLTPRERETLALVAQGWTNLAIAEHLWITNRAVERHINAVYAKLELPEAGVVDRRVRAASVPRRRPSSARRRSRAVSGLLATQSRLKSPGARRSVEASGTSGYTSDASDGKECPMADFPGTVRGGRVRRSSVNPLAVIVVAGLTLLAARPVSARPGRVVVDLGTLGGAVSFPTDISASGGQVVGYSYLADDKTIHGFSWTSAGGIVDLGTLGGSYSDVAAVSPSGQIVGTSYPPNSTDLHAYSWTPAGGMIDLGTLGGSWSAAVAVNPNGEVVGYSALPGDARAHPFYWTRANGMVDLGTLGGSYSYPSGGVSPSGQVVGNSMLLSNDAEPHAFSWTRTGGMIDLGTLGGNYSSAFAVSPNGQVAGTSFLPGNSASRPFSWTPQTGMVDLGTLGGIYGSGDAISPSGQIVGYSYLPNEGGAHDMHAFSWTRAGGMIDLGTLGGSSSWAVDVTPSGQVIGSSYITGETSSRPGPPARQHAFSWTQASGMTDLGTLGGDSSNATGISANGAIIGWADLSGNEGEHAVLWIPATGSAMN